MSVILDTLPVFSLSLRTSGLNKVFLVAESAALLNARTDSKLTEGNSNSSGSLIVASAFFPFAHLESEKGLNKFLNHSVNEEILEDLSKGIEDLYEGYKVLRLTEKTSAEDLKEALTLFEDSYASNSRKLEKFLSHWEVYEYRYEFK